MMIRATLQRTFAIAALFASLHTTADGVAVLNGNDAATRAAKITQDYGPSTDKTECLLFDTADIGRVITTAYGGQHYRSSTTRSSRLKPQKD